MAIKRDKLGYGYGRVCTSPCWWKTLLGFLPGGLATYIFWLEADKIGMLTKISRSNRLNHYRNIKRRNLMIHVGKDSLKDKASHWAIPRIVEVPDRHAVNQIGLQSKYLVLTQFFEVPFESPNWGASSNRAVSLSFLGFPPAYF